MSDAPKEQKKAFAVRTFAADLAANRTTKPAAAKVTTPVKPKVSTPVVVQKTHVVAKETDTAKVTTPVKPKVSTPVVVQKTHVVAKETDTAKPHPSPTKEIPPFHAFQKPGPRKAPVVHIAETASGIDSAALTAAAGKQTVSTLTAPSHGVLVGDAAKESGAATIITDTKYRQFSLGRSLTKTLSSWFEDKKDTITGKKKPKYSVPQADRRKGVIQKATSLTGRASTADHAQVLERLRNNKKNPGTVTPARDAKVVTPNWEGESVPAGTHKVETVPPVVSNVVPVPVVTPTKEAILVPKIEHAPAVKTSVHTNLPTPPITQSHAEPETPTPEPVIRTTPPVTITPIVPAVALEPVLPPPIILAAPPAAQPPVPAVSEELDVEVAVPVAPTQLITPQIPRAQKTKPSLESWFADTNRIVFGGAVIIAGLLILWATINIVTPLIFSDATNAPITVAPLFVTSVQQQLPVQNTTKRDLMAQLQEVTQQPEPLIELQLVAATTGIPVSASQLFTQLNITVPIAFTAAVNTFALGSYRNEPWLALRVVDEATTLGGMLGWEKTMSADLSPWFGEPVPANDFRDDAVGTTDVRMVRTASGTVAIVYGFVQPQVMLITTSESTFLNLMQNLPSQ